MKRTQTRYRDVTHDQVNRLFSGTLGNLSDVFAHDRKVLTCRKSAAEGI